MSTSVFGHALNASEASVMTGIKRSGTWTKRMFGTIWHSEKFEDADKCLMCTHQIPHSLKEHQMVLAKWPEPKVLVKKVRQEHVETKKVDVEQRAENMRKSHARREFRKQVWARS
jgi:hypothetical protein